MQLLEITDILDSQASKCNFIKGLICLAQVDGEISSDERTFFLNASSQLGIKEDFVQELNKLITAKSNIDFRTISFNSKRQAVFFVREALQLCYIDGCYNLEEEKMLHNIAQNCGIEKTIVNEIEKWVLEGINWRKKGDIFLEEI